MYGYHCPQEGYICLGMAPVVDGPDGFMPQKPAQQRLDGEVMQGSIMAGINKEDGSLFAPVGKHIQEYIPYVVTNKVECFVKV